MANNSGTLVTSPIRPQSGADNFPSAHNNELLGGLKIVADNTERDAIPAERRLLGMLCYVTGTDTLYNLQGGILNANWAVFSAGTADATALVKGKLQLAGDLSGTADSPKIKQLTKFRIAPYGAAAIVYAQYACQTQYTNQTEINAALNAASALPNGGIVELLDGDFYVSSAINPQDAVWFKGMGMFNTRIGVAPGLNYAFTIIDNFGQHDGQTEPNSIRWTISDMEIDGSNFNDDYEGKGIFSIKVQECKIERVYVHHTTATGIGVDDFIRTNIVNCLVEFCGYQQKRYITGASYSTSPNTFTFTTGNPHLYAGGEIIVVTGLGAYNGKYAVTASLNANQFTVSSSNNSNPNLIFTPPATRAGTTATVTASSWTSRFTNYTTSADHGFSIGDLVYISGMTPSTFNGYYPVATTTTSTTFSVNMYRNPGAATGSGSATVAGISSRESIGHSGIGIATGAATAETGIAAWNHTRYNQNNNIFYEINQAISGTATFTEQAFQIVNNTSVGAGQTGLRNTGSLNVQINDNYDYGSLVGIRVSAFTLTRPITATSWSGGSATFTTNVNHSYSVGDPVLIYDMVPTAYNGLYTITSKPGLDQFTISITNNPGAASVFGTSKANVHPVYNTQVHDNIVERSLLYAFFQETFCDEVSVQGNEFKNSYLIGAYLTSPNTKFQGNTVRNSGQYGVSIATGGAGNIPISKMSIADNFISNSGQRQSNTYDGIYVQADTSANATPISSLKITDNHIWDDQPIKTQRYGVVLKSNGVLSDVSVSNNDLTGNATAGLLLQNAATSGIEVFNNTGVNPESRAVLGTISGSVTFDRKVAKTFKAIVSADITAVMPAASVDGDSMIWVIQQDGTGGYNVTLPGNAASQAGLTLSPGANAISTVTWVWDLSTTKWRVLSQSTPTQPSVTYNDGANLSFGATTGTKIGTSTGQKLAYFNATPVTQQGATGDLGTVLSNLGLRAIGTAYTFSTSGTAKFGATTIGSTATATSTLEVVGSSKPGTVTQTATNLTLTIAHHRVEVTASATITLPAVSAIAGREYIVINCHTASITVQASGSEVIGNGSSTNTISVAAGAAVKLTPSASAAGTWRTY